MEYSGQVTKYKINRPLTEEEHANRLKQKTKVFVEPHYNLSVIKINNTYLECVDKYYAFKGVLFSFSVIFFGMFFAFFAGTVFSFFFKSAPADVEITQNGAFVFLIAVSLLLLPLLAVFAWHALRESFTWTHYPIRLNRKNRMVYVFRRNGSVLSAPWDDVFFTFGRGNNYANVQNWDIRGHVLDKDGVTVRETFAFAIDDNNREYLTRHWEFIRRYMEEGPRHLIGNAIGQVEMCLPIADRKETFWFGMTRMCSNLAAVPILFWLLLPIMAIFGVGRYLAMLTCRIPIWPQEVEQACRIEPKDPFFKDASMNVKVKAAA